MVLEISNGAAEKSGSMLLMMQFIDAPPKFEVMSAFNLEGVTPNYK